MCNQINLKSIYLQTSNLKSIPNPVDRMNVIN